MTSKLFIRLEDIKERMSINPELEGVDDSLESAIIAAQLRIEAFLDTNIDKKTNADTFYLDKDSYSGVQPGGLFRLYLRNGLVQDSPAFTLSYGSTWNGIATAIPITDYFVDAVRGICYVDNKWGDFYLKAGYTSGYSKASEIPDWLKEAILGYAPVVLNFSHTASDTAKETQEGYRASGDHALAIAQPYTRNIGFMIRPLF